MIIKTMRANFGVLKNALLTLEPGLNVIEAPNESGKSTWCAFLRTMLYGPDARRSREGKRLERQYTPWDGSPMSGEMELEWGGREITLRRFASPAGAMRGFSAVYTDTNVAVSDINESDAGERLTGMNQEVFARTAFIGPGGLGVDQSPELEKRIAALITAGEEGITFSQAGEQLRALQRRLQYHGKGLLPGLEQEMDALSSRMEQIRDTVRGLEELDLREEDLEERIKADPEKEAAPTPVLSARQEAMDLHPELLSREQEYSHLSGELRRSPFRGKEPGEELRKAVREDHRQARMLENEKKTQTSGRKLWLILLIHGALFVLGGVFIRGLLISAGIVLTGSIAAYFFSDRRNRRTKRQLASLLRRYDAKNAAEIPVRYEEYIRQWRECVALRAAAEELRTRSREAGSRHSEPKRLEESAPGQEAPDDTELERRDIAESRARLLGKLEAMGDPATMESRYRNLQEEHARLKWEYEALELALRELTAADEEMHTRFSPALSRTAQGIFCRLTGDRYSRLTFDKNLSAAAWIRGDAAPREEQYLSRGARDQLYLSLRLALCEMMTSSEPCPIILDDALLTFDDERLGLALDHLQELSQQRQIILFTCQDRENRYLAKH